MSNAHSQGCGLWRGPAKGILRALAKLFVYEVEKDIQPELEQYRQHLASVKEEIATLKEKWMPCPLKAFSRREEGSQRTARQRQRSFGLLELRSQIYLQTKGRENEHSFPCSLFWSVA